MKIECPNCHKTYRINPDKLSPGQSAAKCNICGSPISLKQPDQDAKPAKRKPRPKPKIIELKCKYCGENHRINSNKISADTDSIQCKSCGHAIGLQAAHPQTQSQEKKKTSSTEKEATIDKQAAKSPPKPAKPAKSKATIKIKCRHCGKKYRINRRKIPSHANAVRCKVCGKKIRIDKEKPTSIPSRDLPADEPGQIEAIQKTDDQAPILTSLISSISGMKMLTLLGRPKKAWVIAAAACVLIVLGAVVWMNPGLVPFGIFPFGKAHTAADVKDPLNNPEMSLAPTKGLVDIKFIIEPDLKDAIDQKKLKTMIAAKLKQSILPGRFMARGDNPHMILNFDPIDVPNTVMSELTYEVKSIISADGKNVLRKQKRHFSNKIYPGRSSPGYVSLPIQKDVPPEALKTAVIRFRMTIPSELKVLEFNSGDVDGYELKSDKISARLIRLDKDIAKVAFRGGKSAKLIAFDNTGKALAPAESMSSDSAVSTRFHGFIKILRAAVANKILEHAFEVEIDLNEGKAITLPKTPVIPERVRYDYRPVADYPNYTNQDFRNLKVRWTENEESSYTDNFTLKLPKGLISGKADWEIHFFGNDKPINLQGNSFQGFNSVSYHMEKGVLSSANSVFGRILLELDTDFNRLRFVNKSDRRTLTRVLPPDKKILLTFDKNEVTIDPGHAKIVQWAAYDSLGKRIRPDHFSDNKKGTRKLRFWGVPAAIDLDVATSTLTKIINFEIKKRPFDMTAYKAFKQEIENQREIVTLLKKIDRARRNDPSYYGDDLAGLYYLFDHLKNEPVKLVDIQVAHSDPAGQARFGYTVKPYKGYYFTVLSGTEIEGTPTPYPRRAEKAIFKWEKGNITTTSFLRRPDLVAIPENPSRPTFLIQWGPVFMKKLDGEKINFLPENFHSRGWTEAKFVGFN